MSNSGAFFQRENLTQEPAPAAAALPGTRFYVGQVVFSEKLNRHLLPPPLLSSAHGSAEKKDINFLSPRKICRRENRGLSRMERDQRRPLSKLTVPASSRQRTQRSSPRFSLRHLQAFLKRCWSPASPPLPSPSFIQPLETGE